MEEKDKKGDSLPSQLFKRKERKRKKRLENKKNRKNVQNKIFLPQSSSLNSVYTPGCVTWQTAGNSLDAQQGEWSLPSARQEKISVSHGAQIIRSATLVEDTASGSQNLFTQLKQIYYKNKILYNKKLVRKFYLAKKNYIYVLPWECCNW